MRQSFLMNDRIYLRAVEPEDMDIMYEMENDPSMWDISNFTVPYSLSLIHISNDKDNAFPLKYTLWSAK